MGILILRYSGNIDSIRGSGEQTSVIHTSLQRVKSSWLKEFFRIRMILIAASVFAIALVTLTIVFLAEHQEYERNLVVNQLGMQRMYSQKIALEANRLGSVFDAIDSPSRVQDLDLLDAKVLTIKTDLTRSLEIFGETLERIGTGCLSFDGVEICVFKPDDREAREVIAAVDTIWQPFRKASETVLERATKDQEFRKALILINENSAPLVEQSMLLSELAIKRFAEEYRNTRSLAIALTVCLALLCAWIVVGTYRYIIEPYTVFYRGITSLGEKFNPAVNADPAPAQARKSRLMDEVNETFSIMQDMINIVGTIYEGNSFRETLHRIFVLFRNRIPYNYIGVATFTGYQGKMLQASWGESDGSFRGLPARLEGVTVDISITSLGEIIQSGQPRIINDLPAYSTRRPLHDYTRIILDEGVRSSITLPLSVNGKPLGFLFFSSAQTHVYTEVHLQFLRNIRNALALSFEKDIFVDDLVYSSTLALAKMAEAKDEDTAVHLDRMKEYSVLLAKRLKHHGVYADRLSAEFIHSIEKFSPMHDIGKVGIRDDVLRKPGKLDPEEMAHMRTHASYGANVLREAEQNIARSGRTLFAMGIRIAAYHHEKWDGSGYPVGLAGEKIPLEARIVAVADVFDALTTRRPYKEPFTFEDSIDILKQGRGAHFDPAIIDVFFADLSIFREYYDRFKQEMKHDY